MTSSGLGNWEDELRRAVRREFRLGGFTVRNMRGKVYLRKIWADKTSASVTLPIEWREGVQLEVLKAIETINGHLQKKA